MNTVENACDLINGTLLKTYPINHVIATPPSSFNLNSNVSIQYSALPFTVLLAAAVPRGTPSVAAGQ